MIEDDFSVFVKRNKTFGESTGGSKTAPGGRQMNGRCARRSSRVWKLLPRHRSRQWRRVGHSLVCVVQVGPGWSKDEGIVIMGGY